MGYDAAKAALAACSKEVRASLLSCAVGVRDFHSISSESWIQSQKSLKVIDLAP
jgi:hypothetical protein